MRGRHHHVQLDRSLTCGLGRMRSLLLFWVFLYFGHVDESWFGLGGRGSPQVLWFHSTRLQLRARIFLQGLVSGCRRVCTDFAWSGPRKLSHRAAVASCLPETNFSESVSRCVCINILLNMSPSQTSCEIEEVSVFCLFPIVLHAKRYCERSMRSSSCCRMLGWSVLHVQQLPKRELQSIPFKLIFDIFTAARIYGYACAHMCILMYIAYTQNMYRYVHASFVCVVASILALQLTLDSSHQGIRRESTVTTVVLKPPPSKLLEPISLEILKPKFSCPYDM